MRRGAISRRSALRATGTATTTGSTGSRHRSASSAATESTKPRRPWRSATICYLAVLMSNPQTSSRTAATPDLDPAKLAQQSRAAHLRRQAQMRLLKKRRKKSGQ